MTALNPLRLVAGGQPPRGPGQVVIDKHSADVGNFRVGDKIRVLTQAGPGVYTITGIATWGSADSALGATMAVFDPVTAARLLGQPGKVTQLDVAAAPGVSQATLVARIQAAIHNPGIEVVSGQSVTTEGQQTVHQALSIIGTFLLTFGFIALFIGVSALGPFIARPVCRLIGAPLARSGTVGKLGQENAVRNPSRTAATAAALMVGVALVSTITVMASSMKGSVNSVIDSALRADFVVSSGATVGGGSGFSPSLERPLAALPQVSNVAGIRTGVVKVFGGVTPVVATDPAKAAPLFDMGVTQGQLASMTSSGIAVSAQAASDHHLRVGSPVAVTYPTTGAKTYTVQVIYSVRDIAGDYVLPLTAAQANFPQALDIAAFVKLAPSVSTSAARPAIDRVLAAYPNATLQDQAQYKASQAQQVNQLLNLVYGLLGLAVAIALIGIANTLALSIYERTRELGLLRAVGTTRGQLRSLVRYEALVMSLFGAVEGLVLGTLFGWAIVAALHSQGVTHLVFPVPQLLLVTVLAGLAGVVAAIAPSRRAARLNILRAVTTE